MERRQKLQSKQIQTFSFEKGLRQQNSLRKNVTTKNSVAGGYQFLGKQRKNSAPNVRPTSQTKQMRRSMTNFNTQKVLGFDPILTIDSRRQGLKRDFESSMKNLTPTQERSPDINET